MAHSPKTLLRRTRPVCIARCSTLAPSLTKIPSLALSSSPNFTHGLPASIPCLTSLQHRTYSTDSEDYLEYQDFEKLFLSKYKTNLIHFGTPTNYDKSVDALRFIDDFHGDVMIPGVCLVLIDGPSELGEDLVHVKVSRNIVNSKEEEERFVTLMRLLRKVLYRHKLSKEEVILWHQLRGSGMKLSPHMKDWLKHMKYGVKGRTIFGVYIMDAEVTAYAILFSAIAFLLIMALYGKYQKRQNRERVEENYERFREKREREKVEQDKLQEMAMQRMRKDEGAQSK